MTCVHFSFFRSRSIATTLLSLIDASKLHPTPQYEQVVLTFLSTATDLDLKTSEIASVGQVCAQAPQETQDESPNNAYHCQ